MGNSPAPNVAMKEPSWSVPTPPFEFHATTEILERLDQFVCALIPFLALFYGSVLLIIS